VELMAAQPEQQLVVTTEMQTVEQIMVTEIMMMA
jgi:hypothetical protein